MKKSMKIIAFIVAMVMMFTVFAACVPADADFGGGDTTPSPSPTDRTPDSNLGDIDLSVVDPDLTATVTLGNWPPDTAPRAELALFEGFRDIMAAQFPNVTLVPNFYSYTLGTYVPMALGGTAPNLFQPHFTDPQLLIGQHLVADVTDALEDFGLIDMFMPGYLQLFGDGNGRLFGLPRDGYVLGMHLNLNLFEEAGLVDDDGLPLFPKTLQEVAEKGQIIREQTGKAALVFPASATFGGWLFTNIAWNFGAVGEDAITRRDADGRWYVDFTTIPMIAAMEYMHALRWEYDILHVDATTTDWASTHSLLATGEVAMNFAANDAVDNPTAIGGLAVDKFSLIPFPAGPGGAYALNGGTGFMFSPDTSRDQATAILHFLKIAGFLPFINDNIVAAMRAGASASRERGAPVLPPIPAWTDETFIRTQREITEEYSNVDMRLYNDFFDSLVDGSVILRGEEPVHTQRLYRELTNAIQRVITVEDTDIVEVLMRAEREFQSFLDEEVNN
ncbi:MAG: extracellular solute-binding protein [Oscillospiraceae bacterium]|nr:extracellular solute-binding protein [Oscillospiraceae bacterium]